MPRLIIASVLFMVALSVCTAFTGLHSSVKIVPKSQGNVVLNQNKVNWDVCMDEAPTIDCEQVEAGEEKRFCRCWKSTIFPLCEGRHNGHNAHHDDNIGPLVIRINRKKLVETKNEDKPQPEAKAN
mmetsp:Transcript_24011/g.34887  ORF Transcript_24011/g.34887 Transcript_24011/m.34887 type:complete len:126 (+) Transcript_24011:70-447(+)